MDNSTAVGMSSKSVYLSSESIDDKLDMLCWDPLNSLLHDVVAVLILDALQDLVLKFFYE